MKKQLLIIAVGWLIAGALSAHAQTVTTICNFTNGLGGSSGPANPAAALTLGLDGNFYGTSLEGGGGIFGYGTLFRVTTNGTLTLLTNFNLANGQLPYGGLTLGPDGNFYGTASNGGDNNHGTVFQVTPNGTLTALIKFNNTNGAGSLAGLALGPDGNLYGTTWGGGTNGYGTVFQVTASGTLTTLASFSGSNGGNPDAGLTLGPDGNFYGTTHLGLNNEYGTVFKVTTNGILTTLLGFNLTNGAGPDASLTLGPDGNFYGTTHAGGSNGFGTVFKVTTNGTLTTLVNCDNSTNGASPYAALTLGPDGYFYGTARQAGSGGYGTVFKVTTNGALTTLASFYGTNGANPWAALTLGPDGNFYGTTYGGGSGGSGTIFRLELPPDFITSPANQSILIGGTATLNCQPFGTGPFAYQWLSNGVPIVGATGSSLTVSYTSWLANTKAQFQVVVTNNWGSILSSAASVHLVPSNNSQAVVKPIHFFSTNDINGASPSGLTLGSDGNFYGTTDGKRSYNPVSFVNTVFKVTTNGTFTTLANFNFTNGTTPSGLTLGPDGNFYGTSYYGGTNDQGTVFKATPDGMLTTLLNFTSMMPLAFPNGDLTLGPDGSFYGIVAIGGGGDAGGVFKVTTNGTWASVAGFGTDNCCWPGGTLTLGPDSNFYGTASGTYSGGTIFRVTTNGTMKTLVLNAGEPVAALTLGPDGCFYGTASQYYGSAGKGTVFKVATNGLFTQIFMFNGANGAYPEGTLALGPDGSFYGTTHSGGNSNLNNGVGYGTVFKISTRGTLATRGKLTSQFNFSGTNGAYPGVGLTLGPDGNFYGTTSEGGSGGGGTIFRLELPPDFIASPSNQTVALGGAATFSCQPFGTAPFAYQWLSNGVPLPDATGNSLTVANVSRELAGNAQFQVMVANAWGNILSRAAIIDLSPAINTQPALTPVYSFSGNGSDGANPYAGLTLGSDGNFYGTTTRGGIGGHGTVFRLTTAGTLTTLVNFNYASGAYPYAGLATGPDGDFYGATYEGGWATDFGTVFKVTTNGTLTTLVNFTNGNGANPAANLMLGPDGNFYGTTVQGGGNDYGIVFKVTPNGRLTTLGSFNGHMISDGVNPYGGLVVGPDGSFYGNTRQGGGNGFGTVFKVTTNSMPWSTYYFNNTNGTYPMAGLTLGPDGNLYGTTSEGGSYDYGTVFKVTTNGTYTVATPDTLVNFDNSNGAYPDANLILGPDGSFYGTTAGGGCEGYGTVFKVATNGTLTTLASFDCVNGAVPESSLTLGPDGSFYGTTYSGGSGGNGTIFRLNLPPNFITGPADQSTVIGGSVTFNCQPFGTGPFAYQWLSNGIPMTGATGSSFTVNYASWLADTNAQFQVVVANNFGSITSSVAVINLTPLNYSQPAITPVYSFTVGSDGAHPYAGLALGPDGNFYGTAWTGGTGGYGTAFRFTTNGTLTTLVNFNYANGAYPVEDLTLGPDGKLYGTTADGGSGFSGTVFTLTTNGTLTTLVNFNGSANGANPRSDLMLAPDGNFYGTTANGGSSSDGTVFKLTSAGTLTPLASFNFTNGAYPFSGLTPGADGNFYGTTYLGGNDNGSGSGTVFKMNATGMLTTLVSFNNTNGAYPFADLTLGPDGSFYGTTWQGGDASLNNGSGVGTVFKLSNNGTLTPLVKFANTNGAYPFAKLTFGPDGLLYGTASGGGASGYGTVFRMTTNGTLTVLASFNNTNGANPWTGLTLGPDGNFYGTTYAGGMGNNGTIFRLDLPPDFITSPADQSVSLGGAATFNCQPFGTGPFGYQWLSNGIPIAGATGTSLTLSNISWQIINAQFQVVITNHWGSSVSSAASVNLLPNNSQAAITPIYSFSSDRIDGANPYAGLTLGPDGNLYGTTFFGGYTNLNIGQGDGTVFRITTNGMWATLISFNGTNGALPFGGLTLGPDGDFYGTTEYGGNFATNAYRVFDSYGTVFKMTVNGLLTTLVDFEKTNGANPCAGLTLGPDGTFYGTTFSGGTQVDPDLSSGTVFKMSLDGTLTKLAVFGRFDGGEPVAALTLGPDGNFYGTTYGGGVPGGTEVWGGAFRVTPNGELTNFFVRQTSYSGYGTTINAGLALGPDGNFYGAAAWGGYINNGVLFKMTTNGAVTPLVYFVNTNGAHPEATLTLGPDGLLYGTASGGGASGYGTVFRMTINGTLTVLASFNGTNGANPWGSLTLGPDGNFYGTTYAGGTGNNGTIFRLDLPPNFIISPTDQFVGIGGSATFHCQPFGTGPFGYQWLSNGVPIAGATDSSLTLSNISWQITNSKFQVVITNHWGSILSDMASVQLVSQPNIYEVSNSSGGSFALLYGSYPNSTNRLWATTNLALPLAQWQVIATNITDSNGLGQFLDTNTADLPAKYYRLSSP